MTKTILHIIDSLGKVGAESLLVGTINSLPQYEHIVVTLNYKVEFDKIKLRSRFLPELIKNIL